MRLVTMLLALMIGGCSAGKSDSDRLEEVSVIAFDGAQSGDPSQLVRHGERLAELFACNSCHRPDYTGANFGEMIPLLDGLWATNISLTMPRMSDAEIETILRGGKRPDRALYLMPSKQTHFLAKEDMEALIAYLRTIEPAGEATPEPPSGFADAVADRLPSDYWREQEYGRRFYPSAADEVEYYVAHQPPELRKSLARGRYVAMAVCSTCHGANLDGKGENSGSIQPAIAYDEKEFDALLTKDITLKGPMPPNEWGGAHASYPLTKAERADVIRYVDALAKSRRTAAD